MILKREALPVRLHVRGVHTDYVTMSEDSQPMHPGVSQNVGCTRLFFPSSLPPLRSALITLFVSAAALLHQPIEEGLDAGWHESRQHASRGGGSRSARTHSHAVILYPSLYDASSHPLTYTLTYRAVHTQDPLWWLWQPFVRSKRFLSKQNQSPPPSSAAESSGARSLPASLFKSGLKRQADLHSTFTFEKNWGKLGELWLRKC